MQLSIHNHALLRGILAGAVALAGATACSRSDRADAGRDTTQSGAVDTSVVPADTGTMSTGQARTADTGNSAVIRKVKAPGTRIHPGTDSTNSMGTAAASPQDTAAASAPRQSDTASINVSEATAAAGYSEMASDTTSVLAQADTAAGETDAAAPADSDTASIQVQADTTTAQTEVGGDAVTVATGDANATTSDNTSSESSADATGAAPMGGGVTGVDAVATMTRAGARCVVVGDDATGGLWDMADSPAALNPCGTGTMTLSLVRTGEER